MTPQLRALLAALMALVATPAMAETYAVRTGPLITDPALPPRGPSTIIITDGRIVRIDPANSPVPEGAKVVDLSSKTVLPGLIDSHVHLTLRPDGRFWEAAVETSEHATALGLRNALVTARAGFTTVRDLGSRGLSGFAVRDAIAEGLAPGPRVIVAGMPISIIGGHGDLSGFRPEVLDALDSHSSCTGADECAARVREASRRGVDVIKMMVTGGVISQQGRGLGTHMTDAEMNSIITTAHSLGLKVAAHAHGTAGIEAAALDGVDSIEHGTFADAAGISAMRRKGTWLVPTLMPTVGIGARLGKGIYTPAVEEKARQALAMAGKALAAAHTQGVKIAYGTDAGIYEHGRNIEEAELMVRLGGMSPKEVLISATTGAAELLGIQAETGTLEPGKSADLIAIDGDPLLDVKALSTASYVMAKGRPIPMK